MPCDFQNVTDILYRNRKSSKSITYNIIVNTLLGTYLKVSSIYEFPDYTLSKLHNGTIGVSPELKEFYQYADKDKIKKDIKAALDYLFDKPNTYHELYRLIQFDETLSVSMRADILRKFPDSYSNDTVLTDIIYEALYVAITRLYYKEENTVAAKYYTEDIAVIENSLFRNSEYLPPCKHFCGRDKELEELHDIVVHNSTIIVTGIAGIGKSELVRAYIKEHRKEYLYFGYYFYDRNLKEIIADILNDPVTAGMDLNSRYQHNLKLLNDLGEKVLLVIDNFNVTADGDECFDDLCDLKCKVIFTSYMRFEDYVTYEITSFHDTYDRQSLTKYFYQYNDDSKDWQYLENIYLNFDYHTYCMELYAKTLAKGLFTPKSLYENFFSHRNRLKSIVEKISVKKDKHPKKKTYFDHISDLFHLMKLPDTHKHILQVMSVAPYCGLRKDFVALICKLRNMVIIEDLIDVGLLTERDGKIYIPSVIRELVKSELEPDNENCSDLIEAVRAICVGELSVDIIDDHTLELVVLYICRNIAFNDSDFQVRFVHDCFKFTERFGAQVVNIVILSIERNNHNEVPELKALYLSDEAYYELIQKNIDKALDYQMQAVECVLKCDNTILQANTLSTYGYYLNLADRKDDALKAMRSGLELFKQLDGDGAFYFDKYRAVINYADLLFSLGHTNDAVKLVSDARAELNENELQNTEIYADCEYSLGLYHLCVNDSIAGNEIVSAFRTFISLYGRDSDFVQTRLSEVRGYVEMNNVSIIGNEPLHQLLG